MWERGRLLKADQTVDTTVQMDITLLFKACVKTVRMRNKALGVFQEPDRNRILNTNVGRKSQFASRSKEILGQISRLRDFLLEHRKAYLSLNSYLCDEPQLSDSEKDKIDAGAQRIMKTCSALIKDFRRQIAVTDIPLQVMEHQQSVIDLLEIYLKTVCQIYSEQHMIRMKRMIESQKMSRLESDVSLLDDKDSTKLRGNYDSFTSNTAATLTEQPSGSGKINEDGFLSEKNGASDSTPLVVTQSAVHADLAAPFAIEDDQLTAEELQMFEAENAQLYSELNSLSDEVRQIERRVVKIAELQEIFTEKVLQQDKDVERISSMVVGATENVRDANTQIREAIQRNAGLRVWVLFFLLVMSFSLLFLDWYND